MSTQLLSIAVYPATAERWPDLERLFGRNGACAGCWCMWWYERGKEFTQKQGQLNKEALQQMVQSGREPGLLAYANGQPIGWCAVAPRTAYIRLAHTQILAPVDEQPVWSVVCFFVAKPYRRQGVTRALLAAALDYAREHGAKIVEAYPVDSQIEKVSALLAYTGLATTFRSLGFVEAARRSEKRPIMRYTF